MRSPLYQGETAQEVLAGGEPLETVLQDFASWIDGVDEVWARPPKFDCAMLEAAGRAVEVQMPWEYYAVRDQRTLSELALAPEIPRKSTKHDVLADAKYQAQVAAATLTRVADAAETEQSG